MLTQPFKTESVVMESKTPTLGDAVRESVQKYMDTMADEPVTELYEMVLAEIEAPLLEYLLEHTSNNQSRTAKILGLNRGTLRKKLKKYGML